MATPEITPSRLRIRKNGFIGEIFISNNGSLDIYHYVIQREGSREIIYWGQEISLQGARQSIQEFLDSHHASQL